MTTITTLSQFLTKANTQFQIYDLGRRVQHIDMMAFHQIESLSCPYPSPIQGHAQFAIVFWDESQQHFIWFLKLPLDERGLLVPAPRTQFIKMVVEALGSDPAMALSKEQQDKLANHPFAFKPSQEKLALFNALVRKQLGLTASSQYEFAYQYLSGQIAPDMWQKVGLQGIADVCVRVNELDHKEHILNSFDNGALEVQVALCQCFEHLHISQDIADKIWQKFNQYDGDTQLYFLRALASHSELSLKAMLAIQADRGLDTNELVTLAARNWSVLKDPIGRKCFLEQLALQSPHFFNQIFADLVAIPGLRPHLLGELRNPERSEKLAGAIGNLFKATHS